MSDQRLYEVEFLVPMRYRVVARDEEEAKRKALRTSISDVIDFPKEITVKEVEPKPVRAGE